MKKHLDKFKKRSLSWSSLSQWEYDREAWARKYLLGISEPANAQMVAGKRVGELLATIPSFLLNVPRYTVFEKELRFKIGKIPIVGFIDSFQEEPLAMLEYKTHLKTDKWTQEVADSHGQLLLYIAGLWLLYDVPPEKIGCHLVAIPMIETGDFKITLAKKPHQMFEVKHTKVEVLNFLIEVKKIHGQMCEFALQYGK